MGLTKRRMEEIELAIEWTLKNKDLEESLMAIARLAESKVVTLDDLRIEIKKHFDRAHPEMANPNWSTTTFGGD